MFLENIQIVSYQTLLLLPLMLGGYYSIVLMRLPDLALEASFVMGGTIGGLFAFYTNSTLPLGVVLIGAIINSFIGGNLVGFTTSLLREKLSISHLFASIISIGLFTGISRFLLGTAHFSLLSIPSAFTCLASITPRSELILLSILGILLFCMHAALLATEFGLSLEIYGINKQFFKHHHINTAYIGYRGIMLAHGLAGMSGYYMTQSQHFINNNMGNGLGLQIITALLFGIICSEKLHINRLYQPLAGIFCYFSLYAIIIISNCNLTYFNSFQALAVALCCLYRNHYLKQDHTHTRYEMGI